MTATDPTALRARVTTALDGLLARRTADSRSTVLGAGRDDLDAGRHFLHLLDDGGYAAPTWPTEHGGMGLDRAGADIVVDVLRGFEIPDLYPWLVGIDLVGPTILAHASPEQATRWLSPIRTGDEIWCQLFSEPDAGSDLANVKARAVAGDGWWRLNGSKVWTSRGSYSQWGLLLARTDGTVPKHRGMTAFGLDMSLPGITVRPLVQMNGDAHFTEVFFDDVEIPDSDRIGPPGDGWRVAITCLSHERGALSGGLGISQDQLLALGRSPTMADAVRSGVAADAVRSGVAADAVRSGVAADAVRSGVAADAVRSGVAADAVLSYAAPDAVRRDRLARALGDLEILRFSGQRALEARRAGRAPGAEGSLAKLATNRMVKTVAALGLDSEGPAATVIDGTPDEWQTMWLVGPSLSIRGGTDEIQHNILGERILGLPPEPRVDEDKPFDARPDR